MNCVTLKKHLAMAVHLILQEHSRAWPMRGGGTLDYFVLENDSFDELKKMPTRKNLISSGRWSKLKNVDQNRIHPSPDCNMFPFFKGF